MKIVRKMTAGILSLALFISMLYGLTMPSVRAASSGTCGKNLTWKLDSKGTLTISGTGDMYDYAWDEEEGPAAPWGNSYSSDVAIKTVIINDGVTSIGDLAFEDCQELINVEIADSVTRIGDYAFNYCYELTNVEIPANVKSIGDGTFRECGKLTSIEIPASVVSIGVDVFFECYKLTKIDVSKNNKVYSSMDGIVFNKNKTELLIYPYGKPFSKTGSYTIPSGVKAGLTPRWP